MNRPRSSVAARANAAHTQKAAGGPRMAAREVRIIGGQWKRSKLPVADKPGLRPTPDRVRETLFNWLGQDLEGWRVLDAFAGSGALGFEAASRGAGEVVLLERDAELARSLNSSRERLKAANVQVECTDSLAWLARHAAPRFELVLLDPPFGLDLYLPALAAAVPLLTPGSFIYLESGEPIQAPAELGLVQLRSGKAGAVHFQLLQRSGAPI